MLEDVVYTAPVRTSSFQISSLDHQDTGQEEIFIVGSNYFTRARWRRYRRSHREENGGEWIGTNISSSAFEWGSMVNKIKGSGCDVVLSNVVGDSVVLSIANTRTSALTHDKLPSARPSLRKSRSLRWGRNMRSELHRRSRISRPSTPTATRR